MQTYLMAAISAPIWMAGIAAALFGTVGTWSPSIRGADLYASLGLLVVSSGLFYTAAWMCGLLR